MSPSVTDSSLKIFISYSHKDVKDKDKLETHLGVLDDLELWTDTRIGVGRDWRQEINEALNEAAIVVLLITANFLTSQFIKNEEIPKLLVRRKDEGLRIFPLIARECPWELVLWIERNQILPRDAKPIWRKGGSSNLELKLITLEVAHALKEANIKRQLVRESAAEKVRVQQALATEQERNEKWIQQQRDLLILMSGADKQKQDRERWRILQDTQAKIFEIQRDLTAIKSTSQDATYRKWEEYIRA
jgi:TIR domain